MTVAFDSSLVGSPIRADETRVEAAQWSAETVFITLAPAVHGYLRIQLPSEADDLLSDVFLDVARAVGRFRGDEAALRRWVFTIAHHKVVDERRRRARRPQATAAAFVDGTVAQARDSVDPELVTALNSLTVDQCEVVVLRFLADLSLEEVARMAKRRVGAVKALQHRAMNSLAAALTSQR